MDVMTNIYMTDFVSHGRGEGKMKNKIILKGLVLGIILLLTGTTIIPAHINTKQIKPRNMNSTITGTDEPIYNLIGGCNITYDFRGLPTAVKITWWVVPDRNFTYPIINGNVMINYSLKFQSYSNGFYLIPRLSLLSSFAYAYYPDERKIGFDGAYIVVPFTKNFNDSGTVRYVVVESPPIQPPNITGSEIQTWNVATGITLPPVTIGETKRIWLDDKRIDFWANFTQG